METLMNKGKGHILLVKNNKKFLELILKDKLAVVEVVGMWVIHRSYQIFSLISTTMHLKFLAKNYHTF